MIRQLEYEGFEVTAPAGETGVKRVMEEHPEVVLIDINLPNGWNEPEEDKKD
jgi:DNA-binding response OmpR family regulator